MITFTEALLSPFYSIYFKNQRINYICKIDFWRRTGIVHVLSFVVFFSFTSKTAAV